MSSNGTSRYGAADLAYLRPHVCFKMTDLCLQEGDITEKG